MAKIFGKHVPSKPRNLIINGNFDFWERSTSKDDNTGGSGNQAYQTADRWCVYRNVYAAGLTVSQTVNEGPNVTSSYQLKFKRRDANSGTDFIICEQELDRHHVVDMRGKKSTISFWARRGSTDNGTASPVLKLGVDTDSASNLNRNVGSTALFSQTLALTTTWTKFTFTTSAWSSSAVRAVLELKYIPSGTADSNEYIQIAQVMIEEGTLAHEFLRAGSTIEDEFSFCQKYFEKFGTGAVFRALGTTAIIGGGCQFKVTKWRVPDLSLNSQTPIILELAIAARTGSGSTYASDVQGPTVSGTSDFIIYGFTGLTPPNIVTLAGDYMNAEAEL